MIALRQGGKIIVRCHAREFAPVIQLQDKDAVFEDLRRWGLSSANIASALAVDPARVRSWQTRPYRIPDEYWTALLGMHAAARAAIKAKETCS